MALQVKTAIARRLQMKCNANMLRYYISPYEVKRFFNTTHWYDFFKIQRVIHL